MGSGASVPVVKDEVVKVIESGDVAAIRQLIQTHPESINNPLDSANWTPLISAVYNHHNEVVNVLIAAGADLNKPNNGGSTSLILAASNGYKDCVSSLLEAGADTDKQDKDGNTALMMAAKEGRKDCVILLLEAGADKDKHDKDGNTALILAADHDRRDCIVAILEAGVDESIETAIMIAAEKELPEKLFSLLQQESLRKGGGITDKIRAWCTRFPANLKSKRCVSLMFLDFDPFKEGDGVIGKDAARFWTNVLSSEFSKGKYHMEIGTVLDKYIDRLTDLENVKDPTGHRAIIVATPEYEKIMQDRHRFHLRYEFKEGPAEHTSATCVVKLAKDYNDGGKWVALKFMREKDQFERELESRKNGSFSKDFIISIVTSYDGDKDSDFRVQAEMKKLYKYCIVMQAAERNLGTVLAHEHIAGRDWLQIRSITQQLTLALDHMHSKGFIHGDVKPLNIMRIDGYFRLIDLDATVSIVKGAEEYVGAKYSSAYLPPEMIAILDNGTPVVRSYTIDESSGKAVATNNGLPYELVLASAAHDMWSLGVTLFQMYAGEPLFLMNDEGNLSPQQLLSLYEWTNKFKDDRLFVIDNQQARNLISRLLSKNPLTRPDAAHVLAHPFVSGNKHAARMIGEKAEYDLFISYRVNSDFHHAEALYKTLTGLGIKVWWDKMCLKPGVPWEEGFCDGLVNSRTFVCLMSKGAIHHPTVQRQNFANLTRDSDCDNVYLEYRLALELRDMCLIERICPVMIGEVTDTGTYSRYAEYGPWASDEAVDAVESKLREHLDRQGLGAPMKAEASPRDVLSVIVQNQGFFIQGELSESVGKVSNILVDMIRCLKKKDAAVVTTEAEIPLESKGKLSTVGNIDLIATSNDAKKNSATFTSRKMSSDNGYGALLEAQSMVVKLKTLIAESRLQSSSETLRDEVDNVIISSDGKELNKKVHDTMSDYRHFITLESSSKILTWQGKMNGNGNGNGNGDGDGNGNISNENSYRIRLRQEMEIDIDNINSIITLAGGTIVIEIKFKDGSKLSKWETALRNTMSTDS